MCCEVYFWHGDVTSIWIGSRIYLLALATEEQVDAISHLALQINEFLIGFWRRCGITLEDLKLEFGVESQQQLVLADQISPDTC